MYTIALIRSQLFFHLIFQAVRHLPASAQLEYRTLVNRMRNLEKQKTNKLQSVSTPNLNPIQKQYLQHQQSPHKLMPFTVTIPNDQRKPITSLPDRKPTGELKITLKNTGDRLIQTFGSTNSNVTTAATKPDSLMKKVLVKNVSLKVQKQLNAQDNPAKSMSATTTVTQPPPLKLVIPKTETIRNTIKSTNTDVSKAKAKKIANDTMVQSEPVKQLPLSDVSKMNEEQKRDALTAAEKDYTQHRYAGLVVHTHTFF